MAKDTTIYDVARLAGVSTATVSRAFAEPKKVKDKTLKAVLDAAKILNYRPSAIARAMAMQRTDKVAYLICKEGATILDEFYAAICEGIIRSANKFGYQLIISTETEWIQMSNNSQTKQVEGVILGGDANPDTVSELQSRNVKVVSVNNEMQGFDIPCVVSDETGGVRQAVEYMIKKGHTHIGMLAGRFSPYIISRRYGAFMDVMKAHNLDIDSKDVRMCGANTKSAQNVAESWLREEDPPTAIFASNDEVATGVIKAAKKLKFRVPEDIAVIGYDDSRICSRLETELTSVKIDCMSLGEQSMSVMKALLENREDVPRKTVIKSELIVRESV